MASSPQRTEITLYTNHQCQWAHRVHIALTELNLPFEEIIIDLDRPRDPWYLKINPRGLVPSMIYNGQVLTESGVICQFLVDAHDSHLLAPSNSPGGPWKRAQINFFVDAYFSKIQGNLNKIFGTRSEDEANAVAQVCVRKIVEEIEPLLGDALPFFGGNNSLTLAEVLTGSFITRLVVQSEAGGVYPPSFVSGLEEQAPRFWTWARAVTSHPSISGVVEEEWIIRSARARLARE